MGVRSVPLVIGTVWDDIMNKKSDPRTTNWWNLWYFFRICVKALFLRFMMSSPLPTIAVALGYIVTVKVKIINMYWKRRTNVNQISRLLAHDSWQTESRMMSGRFNSGTTSSIWLSTSIYSTRLPWQDGWLGPTVSDASRSISQQLECRTGYPWNTSNWMKMY